MSQVLGDASREWAVRPADERFWTVSEMRAACERFKREARETVASLRGYVARFNGEALALVSPRQTSANMTNWSFRQLSALAGAPASYLAQLAQENAQGRALVMACLNHGLAQRELRDDERDAKWLTRAVNGLTTVHALTTTKYTRVWNADICARLEEYTRRGWRTAPAWACGKDTPGARQATQADMVRGGIVKVGDWIAPAGLYASDRDMFAFLILEDERLRIDDGAGNPLSQGFFERNSEVGDAKWERCAFLYEYVCGNHNVWGVSDVRRSRLVHVGRVQQRIDALARPDVYTDAQRLSDESAIREAREYMIARTTKECVERIAGKAWCRASRKQLTDAIAMSESTRSTHKADPLSAWGVAQGLTRVSQGSVHMSTRDVLDKTAGHVLQLARR